MNYIDTHCHLNFDSFIDPDFEGSLSDNPKLREAVEAANNAGVSKMLVVGCDIEGSKKALDIASAFDGIYASAGVHPTDAHKAPDDFVHRLHTLASNEKVVAIGETGLDYYHKEAPVEVQKVAFRAQISLAKELELPLIIHMRETETDLLEMLKQEDVHNAVIHCFSSNMEFAEACLALGLMLSFTGIVTYPKALEVQNVAASIPLDRLMIETDSPFLAPQKYRGKPNQPAYIVEIAEKIADLRDIGVEEVAEATTKNAERFFGI